MDSFTFNKHEILKETSDIEIDIKTEPLEKLNLVEVIKKEEPDSYFLDHIDHDQKKCSLGENDLTVHSTNSSSGDMAQIKTEEINIKTEEDLTNTSYLEENFCRTYTTFFVEEPQEDEKQNELLLDRTGNVSNLDEQFDSGEHMTDDTGTKQFVCNICNIRFMGKCFLIWHMRSHTPEEAFNCNICAKGFKQENDFIDHMRFHADAEKLFKCVICDKGFTRKRHLIGHTRIHTGEKPFKCDTCDKRFTQKSHLTGHMRIHTGEKPFNCDICNKGFTDNGQLVRHTRIHTGEKPFKCDKCDKRFTQKSHLKSHVIHVGIKSFNCDICDRGFIHKRSLNRHVKKHRQ